MCYTASMNDKTILYICATCGMKKDPATGIKPTSPASEALARDTAALLQGTPVEVRLARCLSLCDTPIAWGLQSSVRHATTFAPATTAEDLAAAARLYIETPPGQKMNKRQLPPALIHTLISRLPPLEEPQQ